MLPKKLRVKANSICPICDTEFYAEPNRIRKNNDAVFCSAKCFAKSGNGGRKRLGENLECKNCGEQFYAKRSKILNGNPQFCCKQCEADFKSAEATARNTRTCTHCGRTFSRNITSIRKTEEITGGKVYCSSVCSHAATRSHGKNKFEIDFHEVFNQLVYTGNGEFVLHDKHGGMNPDFILPGTNKVVELFGNYWHRNDDPAKRIKRLKSLGYDAIVVWEDDFRKHSSKTIQEVLSFLFGYSVHSR